VLAVGRLGAGRLVDTNAEHSDAVYDDDGNEVSPEFDYTSGTCAHELDLPLMRSDAAGYTVRLGSRGDVTLSRGALVAAGWVAPDLEIG